ncbi:MAG: hypothetical protein RLZZ153_777 [Pseudomonadota bacterium]|jgi:pantetheine-phosphate adenylyltransferase
MTRAIYPGTFDPLTRGHEDLVRRAARLFDGLVVGVASSRGKNPLFSVDERLAIAREALADLRNVEVVTFSGLLVQFLQAQNAQVVVRGVRNVADFEYEYQMAGMNRDLYPGTETIFLTPSSGQQFVSGTLVREIAQMGGDVSAFVPPVVQAWIARKLAQPSPPSAA